MIVNSYPTPALHIHLICEVHNITKQYVLKTNTDSSFLLIAAYLWQRLSP